MNNWEYDYSNLYGANANGQSGQNPGGASDNHSANGASGPSANGTPLEGAAQTPAQNAPGANSYGDSGAYHAGSGTSNPYGANSGTAPAGGYGSMPDANGYGYNPSGAGYSASGMQGAPNYGQYSNGGYQYNAQPPKPPKRPKTNRKWLKRVGAGLLGGLFFLAVGFCGGYVGGVAANQSAATGAPASTSASQAEPATAGTQPATEAGALTTSQIASKVGPSVVEVTTEIATMNPFFGQYVESGAGSGVIISQDGYIITNSHVVEGASQVTVTTQDRQSYTATVVGSDSQSDIAVLKIEAEGLTPAEIGDSDRLAVGEFVLAVGNPLGELGGTVTDGIISALNRSVEIEGQTMSLLQMDAAVSPGNSGGGLFDAKGQLIGIVNAKSGGEEVEGIGFAIPINDAMEVAQSLMDNGYVVGRPALGVTVLEITDGSKAMYYGVSQPGVYIAEVSKGGAAEQAGLQPGDMLVSIDGVAISSTSDVTGLLGQYQVGDQIEVQVQRERQIVSVTLTLQDSVQKNQTAESTSAPAQQTQPGSDTGSWNPFNGLW